MARRSRAVLHFDAVPGVKLFVVSTGWPYRPTWEADSPMVFLTCAAAAPPEYLGSAGHICARHLPLLRSVLHGSHDSLFIVDLSAVATRAEWREELEQPGRATKMLAKWLVKFNPRGAKFVVNGEDACLLEAALKLQGGGHVPEGVVGSVVVTGEDQGLRAIMQQLGQSCQTVMVRPTLKTVKAALTKGKQRLPQAEPLCMSDLFVVSVDFKIDASLKQLVQKTRDVTAAVLCENNPVNIHMDGGAQTAPARCPVTVNRLEFGSSFTGLHVQVLECGQAGDMMRATIADPHASVEALVPEHLQSAMSRGAYIYIAGQTVGMDGRLLVLVSAVEDAVSFRHEYSSVRVGQRSLSQRFHRVGCLLIRGGKCALQRKDDRLQIPTASPTGSEAKLQTGTRAVTEACKVFAEELAILQDMAPAVAYECGDGGVTVVTVFAAMATAAKAEEEGGCGCGTNADAVQGPYEWCSCEDALASVSSEVERTCIMKIVQSLAEAAQAGLLGRAAETTVDLFRPALPAALNELSLSHAMALMDVVRSAGSLEDDSSKGQKQFTWVAKDCKAQKPKRMGRSCCSGGRCGKKGCC